MSLYFQFSSHICFLAHVTDLAKDTCRHDFVNRPLLLPVDSAPSGHTVDHGDFMSHMHIYLYPI